MAKTNPAWGTPKKVRTRKHKKDGSHETVFREISYQPKKLTKGLKRQIRRVMAQNPAEAERQMQILGVKASHVAKKASKR